MQTSARLLFHRTQRNERDGATEGRQGSAVAGLFEDERRSALDAVRWRFGSREPLDREGAAVMEAGRLTRKREGGDPGQQGDATAAAGRGKRARRTPRSGGRTEAPAAGAAKAVRNKSRLLDAQLLRGVRVWLIGESASAEGDDSVVKRLEALGAIVVPTDDRWEEVVQFAPATEDVDEVVANGDAAANRTVLVVAPTRWNWWDVLQQRSLESVEDAELQAQLATARLMLDQGDAVLLSPPEDERARQGTEGPAAAWLAAPSRTWFAPPTRRGEQEPDAPHPRRLFESCAFVVPFVCRRRGRAANADTTERDAWQRRCERLVRLGGGAVRSDDASPDKGCKGARNKATARMSMSNGPVADGHPPCYRLVLSPAPAGGASNARRTRSSDAATASALPAVSWEWLVRCVQAHQLLPEAAERDAKVTAPTVGKKRAPPSPATSDSKTRRRSSPRRPRQRQ
ncbi:hypothetical protein CDCA_CDCA08G2313 [Cyanidium caldarium]|uniref:BRCT domain-containing protein n=1 Tax=Cyanidium caldarium TaxID=2771 RepID=A0AAV9IW30_CYACA|nr:hypothetical protein CDCA_CDCA08G2313 [Cyanidium caldarium]